ncbi:hypothetical protein LSTR_LSTR005704 [Laodelphax striatellus]|uniref:Uncharacterized protein n=1 Tax=Laodelphax striatellus TaxID=195883 RepID=A0A482XQ70_LAOST|nr:hypothetical protein LSTR_LSTR005704 [Laodelphax striatellus]
MNFNASFYTTCAPLRAETQRRNDAEFIVFYAINFDVRRRFAAGANERRRGDAGKFSSGGEACLEGDGESVVLRRMAAAAASASASAEEVRQQRIARYKEERRRQLAAQFGRRDAATAPSPLGDAAPIRTTRASRLRSAASLTTVIVSKHNDTEESD